MTIILYDLCGKNGKRFSPFGWRTRMALAHKGLEHHVELVKFTEKSKVEFSGQKLVPVLKDEDNVVSDSFAIAEYLEDAYPDRPSLFGSSEGRGMAKAINNFVDMTIMVHMGNMIVADVSGHVDPACLDYFTSSREARFGKPLPEVQVGRDDRVVAFRKTLEPIRRVVQDQPFIGGDRPTYADFPLFGVLQWARCTSTFAILEPNDPIRHWFERLLEDYDGVGKSEPAAV
ncbi:MAG: glutathione S-transferase family protein [Alphaproteobacteria bacterium]|nr:glutathione S-transferase family protein [Alphaproteobacteria bacterium]